MRTPLLLALSLLVAAAPTVAEAAPAPDAHAPAGGGLGSLAVRVDLPSRVVMYRTCATPACDIDATSASVKIDLDPDDMPRHGDILVEVLPIGSGKSVVHVRIPSVHDRQRAWEAVIAAGAAPIFAGPTGFVKGEEGERRGPYIQILDDGAIKHVIVGEAREDLHICGQTMTMLSQRGLDPGTLELRGATVQRLPLAQRQGAKDIGAVSHGGPADPPLANLLRALGASSSIGPPTAIADGDPETTWSEDRPGRGQGEFVMLAASPKVPVQRFSLAIAPHTPKTQGASPETFFLVTDHDTFRVKVPDDGWKHPGTAYDIPLPDPLQTSCLALVLDDAFDYGRPHPEVTVAELYAYSAFDKPGATLEDVAKALGGGGSRAEAAAGVLARAGSPGFTALAAVYDQLDAAGRGTALEVATSAPCDQSARLLLRALGDTDVEVRRKARVKLENPVCLKAAVPALIAALDEATLRGQAAPLLASAAPSQALAPLAKVMGGKDRGAVRKSVRSAFAKAASSAEPSALASLLADVHTPEGARLELVRASQGRLTDVPAAADGAIGDLLGASPPMRTRYLLVEPLATLAHAGDAVAIERFIGLLSHDPDGPVRAHAAELAADVSAAQGAVVEALRDPDPRVREAALRTLAKTHAPSSADAVGNALLHDAWTFVRTAAADALAAMAPSAEIDRALTSVLGDPSPRVKAASITALAARHATRASGAIRERLEDDHEELEVRLSAARALGALCDARSQDRLTELARGGAAPLVDDEAAQLSLAATEALGILHPADLADRLAPLRAKGAREEARQAAARALASRLICR